MNQLKPVLFSDKLGYVELLFQIEVVNMIQQNNFKTNWDTRKVLNFLKDTNRRKQRFVWFQDKSVWQ